MKPPQKTSYNLGGNFPNSKNKKNPLWKNVFYFRKLNILAQKCLIKLFYTLNKTPLGETGFLNNLYHLLAVQASTFLIPPFRSRVSQDTFGILPLTVKYLFNLWGAIPTQPLLRGAEDFPRGSIYLKDVPLFTFLAYLQLV